MTPSEYMFILTIGVAMIGFMIGSLWEHARHELKNEEDLSNGK